MRRLSELEKSEIWDRFEAGESQRSISRRAVPQGATRPHIIAPPQPAPRGRAALWNPHYVLVIGAMRPLRVAHNRHYVRLALGVSVTRSGQSELGQPILKR